MEKKINKKSSIRLTSAILGTYLSIKKAQYCRLYGNVVASDMFRKSKAPIRIGLIKELNKVFLKDNKSFTLDKETQMVTFKEKSQKELVGKLEKWVTTQSVVLNPTDEVVYDIVLDSILSLTTVLL